LFIGKIQANDVECSILQVREYYIHIPGQAYTINNHEQIVIIVLFFTCHRYCPCDKWQC